MKNIVKKNYNCFLEVEARKANIIHVSDWHEGTIKIEHNKIFGGLLANCIIQYLSFYISVKNGNNPDYPRNLAKCVTVE